MGAEVEASVLLGRHTVGAVLVRARWLGGSGDPPTEGYGVPDGLPTEGYVAPDDPRSPIYSLVHDV